MNKIMLSLNENYVLNKDFKIKNINRLLIPKDKIPVYVILGKGESIIDKAIRKVTNGDFSHASISINGLDRFYSFNVSDNVYGFSKEDIPFLLKDEFFNIRVYTCFVKEDQYKIMVNLIKDIMNTKNSYNASEFLTFPFRKEYDLNGKTDLSQFYCSEFVLWILNKGLGNTIGIVKNSSMSPSGMIDIITKLKMHCIYDGPTDKASVEMIENFEKRNNVYDRKIEILKSYNME